MRVDDTEVTCTTIVYNITDVYIETFFSDINFDFFAKQCDILRKYF